MTVSRQEPRLTPKWFSLGENQIGLGFKEIGNLTGAVLPVRRIHDIGELAPGSALILVGPQHLEKEMYECRPEHYRAVSGITCPPISPDTNLIELSKTLGDWIISTIYKMAIYYFSTLRRVEQALHYDPQWKENFYKSLVHQAGRAPYNKVDIEIDRRRVHQIPYTMTYTPAGRFIHTKEVISDDNATKKVMGGFDLDKKEAIVRSKLKKGADPVHMQNEFRALNTLRMAQLLGLDLSNVLIPRIMFETLKPIKDNPGAPPRHSWVMYSTRLNFELNDVYTDLSYLDKLKVAFKLVKQIATIHKLKELNPVLKSIAHGDLKLENVLLSDDKEPFIIDWGFAKDVGPYRVSFTNSLSNLEGTKGYLPPEVYHDRDFAYDTVAFDKWCLGIILHLIFKGSPPWFDNIGPRSAKTYMCKIDKFESEYNDTFTGVEKVYRGYLRKNPVLRMSEADAVQILGQAYCEALVTVSKRKAEAPISMPAGIEIS